MKTWKSNLAMKIAACILFAVCLAVAGLSLLGIVMGYDLSVYGPGAEDPTGQNFIYYNARNFAYSSLLVPYREQEGSIQDLDEYARSEYSNFLFAIYEVDEDGKEKLLASNLKAAECSVVMDEIVGMEITGGEPEWQQYHVVVALKNDMPAHWDNLYQQIQIRNWLEPREKLLILALVLSVLLGVVDFILLCTMAGHRRERDGITLNWADKIPLDVYAALVLLIDSMLVVAVMDFFLRSWDLFLNTLGAVTMLTAGMLVLAVLLSLVSRVKAGGWWKNTVIYKACSWIWRNGKRLLALVVRVFRAIPMAIRSCLVTALLLIILFILGWNAEYDSFAVLLYFLLSAAIFSAVALAVYQLRQLQKGGQELAAGHFETKIDTKHLFWEFRRHAEDLNSVGRGMSLAVDQKMRSERLKTELITNVSHDIKTPLTSIVNYVDLLQKPHTEEEGTQYLEVLARQSARLKKLTEDLVEASKASTGNLSVNLVPINVKETIDQALGEYQERMTAGGLEAVVQVPEEMPAVLGDGRLLWRILDNLLNNVCKYALAGTRVYVTAEAVGKDARISVKNISRQQLNITADELMERFVRGDTARSTEGSGLGLNIAKSLAELQRGRLSLTVDGDLFKAELRLPLAE